LWEGHLRSAGHVLRQQKLESDQQAESFETPISNGSKKRKASDEEDTIRKRTKAANGIPEGFFDPESEPESATEVSKALLSPKNEIQIPSRPATPSKPVEEIPKRADVDEDEWAAFEADIAAAEVPVMSYTDGVISAPALSTAELAAKEKQDEDKRRRERQEAELEGDKVCQPLNGVPASPMQMEWPLTILQEDAARKLEDEFEEMESLEQRVKRLREKREALRNKESMIDLAAPKPPEVSMEEDDEDDEEFDDDWDGFRMKG
jgi:zinc finger protein 830